jgi:protein tyrosine phosphatase
LETRTAGHLVRKFQLSSKGETREVYHYHFLAWPDHGVPKETETLNALIRDLHWEKTAKTPIIVHCSAGIGRTGTLIALSHLKTIIDTQKQQGIDLGVSIFSIVRRLREQRNFMVQSKEQYEILFDFVSEWTK